MFEFTVKSGEDRAVRRKLFSWWAGFGVAWGLVQALPAHAYPSFIGYGYTSCLVCHFNAFGNGPLTDYGRALGATAIAAKPFYNPSISDEALGEQSGFLGSVPFPDFLRLAADYRGMWLNTALGKDENQRRLIHMQADLSLILRALEDDKLLAVVTAGYLPPSAGSASSASSAKWVTREHYIMARLAKRLRLYTGLMDVAYGIRVPDHIAAGRVIPKLTQKDQVHGVALHVGRSNAEFGVHAFAGNLLQDSELRPVGASVFSEFDVAEKVRVGASGLYSKSKFRDRAMGAVHMRLGVGTGSAGMVEAGLVRDVPKGRDAKLASYFWTQTMTRLARGYHLLFTGEYNTQDTFSPSPRNFRVGPSLQVFPMQRLEFRVDLLASRTLGLDVGSEPSDTMTLLMQVHLWF